MIQQSINETNPFCSQWNAPHETAPFDKIKTEHFEPAFLRGIELHKNEIAAITNDQEMPSFENTIVTLEHSGKFLDRVSTIFSNLLSAETTDELDNLAQKLMPVLSTHANDIKLDEKLFARVKFVYEQKEKLNLSEEQEKLLTDTYEGFARNGANLNEAEKQKYRQLTEQLSLASLKYSRNLLKETNDYYMHLTDKKDIEGLPDSAIEAAQMVAKERNLNGWVVTLDAPSYGPFMKYAENRELRHKLYIAYNTKCTKDNDQSNFPLVKEIANLKMGIAQLLGYACYADYALQERMAKQKEEVYKLLDDLKVAYLPKAEEEVKELKDFAIIDDLQPWDLAYYSNKMKESLYHFDDEELRPYFELKNVIKGVFGLATKLYGITFKENSAIPVYHPDVKAYEVFDNDGSYLAVLYADFFPRPGKKGGAWMTSFKEQWIEDKKNSRPHISLVMNFTKPTDTKPALLTLYEVETFLHEFGHSLHGMFANTHYQSLSGTNVYWDFVELPSQFMENYVTEKDFLDTFAFHYQTGEPIPAGLIEKVKNTRNYQCGYQCIRQLCFGYLDMAWFAREKTFEEDIISYERKAMNDLQLLPIVPDCCMSVQFSHIFAGGYSAGYYSYKWAEVLDADAFALFQDKGIFNNEVAQSFRNNVLSKGGTEDPSTLYIRFRGQKPSIKALLNRNGIKYEQN
jgi:peptidyl-dipeptidase Dcp